MALREVYVRGGMSAEEPPVKRRIRAAMVLADLDFQTLADRIDTRGLRARTLRKLADENDDRAPRTFELDLIADACDTPRWFLAHGWTAAPAAEEPDRFADLERRMGDLESLVTERLERELEEGLRAAREELGLAPQPVADRRRTGRRKNGSE